MMSFVKKIVKAILFIVIIIILATIVGIDIYKDRKKGGWYEVETKIVEMIGIPEE